MDINILREAVTVASFLAFLGIVAYAAHPRNAKRFAEAARIPLDDEGIANHVAREGAAPEANTEGAAR